MCNCIYGVVNLQTAFIYDCEYNNTGRVFYGGSKKRD